MKIANRYVWNDSYSVKVPSLDEQHKGFFRITNQILDLLEQPENPDIKQLLLVYLVDLGSYALHHLDYEESCIDKYRCENCRNHPEFHQVYREKVKDFMQAVRNSDTSDTDVYKLAQEVATFTQSWLTNHILKRDRDYIDCMVGQKAQ